MTRLLTPQAYGALKGATAAALAIATPKGSAEAFAPLTRVEARTVRKYADHSDEMFAPIDVAADLDRAAGKPILTSALAQICGLVVARVEGDPHARVMSAIKETSEAVAAIASLDAAGGLDTQQIRAARAELREAIAALVGHEQALTAKLEGSS